MAEKEILQKLRKNKIQLICLAGFMKSLSKNFINNFSLGFFEGLEYFINTDQIQSPFFYILISFLEKFLNNFSIKLLFISISSLIPLIFYIALKKKFRKVKLEVENNRSIETQADLMYESILN